MISIRTAMAADTETLNTFIRASAAEQNELSDVITNPQNLLEDGFGPHPIFSALIAEQDGVPAGFALYFPDYSTWRSRRGLYLEDLYVAPQFRRLGIAKHLMIRLTQIAVEAGCGRVNWLVLRENEKAVAFYRSIGAALSTGWVPASLTGVALENLARHSGA